MGIATTQKVYISSVPLEKAVPENHPSRYPAWPGLVFLFLLLPLILLPELARREAVRHLESRLNVSVAIRDVDLNPFTGRAQIKDLVIGGDRGGQPVLRVPVLDLTLDRDALLRRDVIIHRVTAHHLALHLERTGPTHWNIDPILRSRWEGGQNLGVFTIGQIQVTEGSITVVDRTTTPIVTNVLEDLDLTLQPVPMTADEEPGQIVGKARMGEGSVQMSGTLHLNPFESHLALGATRVPVAGMLGYVNELLGNGKSLGGTLDGRLQIAATLDTQGYLLVQMDGGFQGRGLEFWIPGYDKPFFHATEFTADKARVSLTPRLIVEIPNVKLTDATVRLMRDPKGALNVRRLWGDVLTAASTNGSTPHKSPAPDPPLVVKHLTMHESRIEFVDATLNPTFTGALSDMRADIHNAHPHKDRATFALTGTLSGSAPVALKGWFTPAKRPPKFYIEGTVRDFELSHVNAYAEKYIRHTIRRGRVTTDVKYTYDGRNLNAGNVIRLRQVKVGDPLGAEFEAEVGIPLKLALALLEGSDGEILMRVPIEGNLDHPEMQLNGVVWEAVRNAILKTVTIPFQLFGKILKAGGKILSVQIEPVTFQPGSVTPNARGKERLERLVTFLKKRPQLELELEGRASLAEAKAVSPERRRGRVATEHELRKLADDRARYVERTLVARGIAPGRLFILNGDADTVTQQGNGHVEFSMLN